MRFFMNCVHLNVTYHVLFNHGFRNQHTRSSILIINYLTVIYSHNSPLNTQQDCECTSLYLRYLLFDRLDNGTSMEISDYYCARLVHRIVEECMCTEKVSSLFSTRSSCESAETKK